jgi:hypothetical protein
MMDGWIQDRDVVWERTEWFHFVFPSIMDISAQQRFPGMAIPRARQPVHARAGLPKIFSVFGVNTHALADNITEPIFSTKLEGFICGIRLPWRMQMS